MVIDGYVRVSQLRGREGESFSSPMVQGEQIRAWATMRGAQVGRVFEELDVSGARVDRPLLEEALSRIESGESDGLVVAKLDRFGRSLIHSLAAVERIQAAGGTFVSVQDGFDLSTDHGRLVLRMMLSWAEWELDRIRAGWRTARARAVARGIHMGGRPPAGYQHDEARRLQPHPNHGPIIGAAFTKRAEGMTLERVAAFLTDAKVPSAYSDGPWTVAGLRCVLANRVYLGELHNGEFVHEHAHPPLTDPVTWQLAQSPRLRSQRTPGQPTPLGGLVQCGTCGRVLQSHSVVRNGRRHRTYACRRDDCGGPVHITGGVLEPYVEACFFALLDEQAIPAELEALQEAATEARAALVAYRDDAAIQAALGRSTSRPVSRRACNRNAARSAPSRQRATACRYSNQAGASSGRTAGPNSRSSSGAATSDGSSRGSASLGAPTRSRRGRRSCHVALMAQWTRRQRRHAGTNGASRRSCAPSQRRAGPTTRPSSAPAADPCWRRSRRAAARSAGRA